VSLALALRMDLSGLFADTAHVQNAQLPLEAGEGGYDLEDD